MNSVLVVKGLTPIALPSEGLKENVHSGALPPWLDASEENERNLVNGVTCLKSSSSASAQKGKRKLNPKRVGAAWAEKRRAEIEREKRGEIAANICDANWLPNFGRVWQSGTRRESKREFEKEKHKLNGDKNHPEVASEVSFKIQPYISKRMVNSTFSNNSCFLSYIFVYSFNSYKWMGASLLSAMIA